MVLASTEPEGGFTPSLPREKAFLEFKHNSLRKSQQLRFFWVAAG